jgi:DNA-binding transcriptional MerR regulator
MTRANIRFYEQEGLISPRRGVNDYREYTDDNLQVLMKIKLLRRLQVPLEVIRMLQTGEKTLSDTLDEKLRQLEGDIKSPENAGDICRDIVTALSRTFPLQKPVLRCQTA